MVFNSNLKNQAVPVKYLGKFSEHLDTIYGTGTIWTQENNIQMVPILAAQKMLAINRDVYAAPTKEEVVKVFTSASGEAVDTIEKDRVAGEAADLKAKRHEETTRAVELRGVIEGIKDFKHLEKFVQSDPGLIHITLDKRMNIRNLKLEVLEELQGLGKVL